MSSEQTGSAGSTGLFEFLAWLEVNKKRLITLAVVVVAVGLAVYFIAYTRQQREIRANQALFNLGMPLQQGENTPPIAAAAYLKMASGFGGTRAAEKAMLLAAGALFSENRYADAQTQFEKFLSEYNDSALAPAAALGVAACLESLDKLEEALKAYQGVITRYPEQAGKARLAAARLYEAKNQPAEALKLYDALIQPPATSVWAGEARELKDMLLRKYPQLAVTNAAKPAVFAPVRTTNAPAPGAAVKTGATSVSKPVAAKPAPNAAKPK
jgi:predicted negative regulator of RcsB-dependent stress response